MFGDVNGSGSRNVADVLCLVVATLTQQGGGSLSSVGCLSGQWLPGDLSCDGTIDIIDTTACIHLAIGLDVPAGLSPDGTGCPAACEVCAPSGGASCLIGGACVPEGERAGADGCQICDPAQDAAAYTNETCSNYYRDVDGDGFGVSADSECRCVPSNPYAATQGGDCDDDEELAFPGNPELCDGIDNDCANGVDDAFPTLNTACDGPDTDDCAYGAFTCKADQTDVECTGDSPSDISEVCGNSMDDDCNGQTDEGCFESLSGRTCQSILYANPGAPSGVYTIDPNGGSNADAFDTYCDMTRDGGGWTLVLQNVGAVANTDLLPPWNRTINETTVRGGILSDDISTFDILVGLSFWGAIGHVTRLDMGNTPGSPSRQAFYNDLTLAPTTYALSMSGETVTTAGGSPSLFTYHAASNFGWSTYDQGPSTGCASQYGDGWWYGGCWSGNIWGSNYPATGHTANSYWTSSGPDYWGWGALWLRESYPANCSALQVTTPSAGSGVYWIDPDGTGGAAPFRAYCDMTTDDGGWTLVVKVENGSTSAHRTQAALNTGALTDPAFSSTAKYSDAVINQIRQTYPNSILRIEAADGKRDYFREDKAFDALATTASMNQVYGTYADATALSGVCSGSYNTGYHTGLVGWDCHDSFLYGDNPGFRNASYQAGRVWVKSDGLGLSAATAADSCLQIHDEVPGAGDGAYWILTDHGARELFCDMSTDGGGWTLVGQMNARADVYDSWLRADMNASNLVTSAIEGGVISSVGAIDMAVHYASAVRFSNQARDRWVKWNLPAGRTTATWWDHTTGPTAVNAAAQTTVTATGHTGSTSTCYQNVYGIMPLGGHGGSYPAASMNVAGNTTGDDWCMAAGVLLESSSANGWSTNGNGHDAPTDEATWPNSAYDITPRISVWLR